MKIKWEFPILCLHNWMKGVNNTGLDIYYCVITPPIEFTSECSTANRVMWAFSGVNGWKLVKIMVETMLEANHSDNPVKNISDNIYKRLFSKKFVHLGEEDRYGSLYRGRDVIGYSVEEMEVLCVQFICDT